VTAFGVELSYSRRIREKINVVICTESSGNTADIPYMEDICTGLQSVENRWYHLGLGSLSRNNLSHSLSKRSHEVFEKTFYQLLSRVQNDSAARKDKRFRFNRRIPMKLIFKTFYILSIFLLAGCSTSQTSQIDLNNLSGLWWFRYQHSPYVTPVCRNTNQMPLFAPNNVLDFGSSYGPVDKRIEGNSLVITYYDMEGKKVVARFYKTKAECGY
jgi:hypothetical protein